MGNTVIPGAERLVALSGDNELTGKPREAVQNIVATALAALPAPERGEKGEPGYPGPRGEQGEPGVPGRDATPIQPPTVNAGQMYTLDPAQPVQAVYVTSADVQHPGNVVWASGEAPKVVNTHLIFVKLADTEQFRGYVAAGVK